jgi:2-dehydropantoate 2-reductase
MKIAIIGGAGAMGGIFGGRLAQADLDVTLVDIWGEAIDAINANGLRIEDQAGDSEIVRLRATSDPESVGPVDLAIVFVKCYHTEQAVRSAMPLIGSNTTVLTLQNGWATRRGLRELSARSGCWSG